MKNKVLIIGDLYFETHFFLDNEPSRYGLGLSHRTDNVITSKTLNAARAMNSDCIFFAKVADDSLAEKVINAMNSYGIGVENIQRVPNQSTGQVQVLTFPSGKSSITIFFGVNEIFTSHDLVKIEMLLDDVEFVYTATFLPPDFLGQFVQSLKRKRKTIFLDFPNNHKSVDHKSLAEVDFVMPNREEAEMILDLDIKTIDDAKTAIYKLRESYHRTIIVTLDADGCILLESGSSEPVHYPTRRVEEIDSAGCGDVFRRIFTKSYMQTKNIDVSIEQALTVATDSIRYRGIDEKIKNLRVS